MKTRLKQWTWYAYKTTLAKWVEGREYNPSHRLIKNEMKVSLVNWLSTG